MIYSTGVRTYKDRTYSFSVVSTMHVVNFDNISGKRKYMINMIKIAFTHRLFIITLA